MYSCSNEQKINKELNIDFFTTNKYKVTPPDFKTFYETILKTEEHHKGATFDTIMIEVLSKEGSIIIESEKKEFTFPIALDYNDTLKEDIVCYVFNLDTTVVPPQYESFTYNKVLIDGDGEYVEAQYEQRSYLKVDNHTTVDEYANYNRLYETYSFTIDDGLIFEDYFMSQIDDNESDFILENGINYRIK